MYNKIKIYINDKEYTILSSEEPGYVMELGNKLDLQMREILDTNPSISFSTALVLSAMSYLSDYTKGISSADNMREQIKNYLEDAASATVTAQKEKQKNRELTQQIKELESMLAVYQQEQPVDLEALQIQLEEF